MGILDKIDFIEGKEALRADGKKFAPWSTRIKNMLRAKGLDGLLTNRNGPYEPRVREPPVVVPEEPADPDDTVARNTRTAALAKKRKQDAANAARAAAGFAEDVDSEDEETGKSGKERRRDDIARRRYVSSAIRLSMDNTLAEIVEKENFRPEQPSDLWDYLELKYGSSNSFSRFETWCGLAGLNYDGKSPEALLQFTQKFELLAAQLLSTMPKKPKPTDSVETLLKHIESMEAVVDEFVVFALLKSLPPTGFETVIQTYFSVDAEFRAELSELLRQLQYIQQFDSLPQNTTSPSSSPKSLVAQTPRKTPAPKSSSNDKKEEVKCSACGKMRHDEEHCWKIHPELRPEKFKEKVKVVGSGGAVVGAVVSEEREDATLDGYTVVVGGARSFGAFMSIGWDWIADTGCSLHMSNDKKNFVVESTPKNEWVTIANDKRLPIEARGKINIKCLVDGKIRIITLKDAALVPKLAISLFSVSQACANPSFAATFNSLGMELIDKKNNVTIFTATAKEGLYFIDQPTSSTRSLPSEPVVALKAAPLEVWHRRMGHLNVDGVKKLKEDAIGVDFSTTTVSTCEPCLQSKAHRLPFPKESQSWKLLKPFEYLHFDLCDFKIDSFDGKRYNLLVKDGATGFAISVPIKLKSDATKELIKLIAFFECQFGGRVKSCRSDPGGEFKNAELDGYFEEMGIVHYYSVADEPAQDGVAERANRTINEMARAMCLAAKLPLWLWSLAVKHASFIRNRVGSRSRNHQSPYLLVYGRKPDLSFLYIFGAPAFSLLKRKKHKLGDKTKKLIYVGPAEVQKGVLLYDASKRKVEVRRNVYVDESFETAVGLEDLRGVASLSSSESSSGSSTSEGESGSDEESSVESVGKVRVLRRSTREKKRSTRLFGAVAMGVVEGVIEALVDVGSTTVPKTIKEARASPQADKWDGALNKELATIKDRDVYDVVRTPPNVNPVLSRIVFNIKSNGIFKARLVGKGYMQRAGVDYGNVFSAVLHQESLHILLGLATSLNLEFHTIDIVSAFLYGTLDTPIHMLPPKGVEIAPGYCWRVKKSLYGFAESPAVWKKTFDEFFTSIGMTRLRSDECVFAIVTSKVLLVVGVYVDDGGIVCNSLEAVRWIKKKIEERFDYKDGGEVDNILGMEVTRDREKGEIRISQVGAIRRLMEREGINVDTVKARSTPLNNPHNLVPALENDETLLSPQAAARYISQVGSLLWINRGTRPDLSYPTGVLSQFGARPTKAHQAAMRQVLEYLGATYDKVLVLKSSPIKLPPRTHIKFPAPIPSLSDETLPTLDDKSQPLPSSFPPCLDATPLKSVELVAFADASYADGSTGRRSTTGITTFLDGSLVGWSSKVQRSVSTSTLEAEFVSMTSAGQGLAFVTKFLSELNIKFTKPVIIANDNLGAISVATNPQHFARSKHINLRYNWLREKIHDGDFSAVWVATKDMIADVLTKPLGKDRHWELVEKMGVQSIRGSVEIHGLCVMGTWDER